MQQLLIFWEVGRRNQLVEIDSKITVMLSALQYKHKYYLHCTVLVLQAIAFCISLLAGVAFLLSANYVSSARYVVAAVQEDDHLSSELHGNSSDLRVSLRVTDSLHLLLLCAGVSSVSVAALVLVHLSQEVSLMLGPHSSLVRGVRCLDALRDRVEDELLMLRAKREVKRSAAATAAAAAAAAAADTNGGKLPVGGRRQVGIVAKLKRACN